MIAVLLLILGLALYADRIDDQERCEAQVRAEAQEQQAQPTRDDYRRRCAVLRYRNDNKAPP